MGRFPGRGNESRALQIFRRCMQTAPWQRTLVQWTIIRLPRDVGSRKMRYLFCTRWGAMVPVVDAVKANPEARIVSAKIPDGMGEGSSKPYIPTTPEPIL